MLNRSVLVLRQVLGVLAVVIAAAVGSAVAQDILHMESQLTWYEGPSPLTTMNKRINQEAQKLPEAIRQGGAIKRVVFYDIAYPSKPQEFATLDGNAVMLVTALSHDQAELPLKRVYVNADGETIELKRITYILSKQAPKSLAAKTFGQYRMDGMYLFPVYLKTHPGKIATDFARNRDGFGLTEFDGSDLGKLRGLPLTPPSGKGPPPNILKQFMAREFPGFKLP